MPSKEHVEVALSMIRWAILSAPKNRAVEAEKAAEALASHIEEQAKRIEELELENKQLREQNTNAEKLLRERVMELRQERIALEKERALAHEKKVMWAWE